jgi:hypothetical protein
MAAFALAEVVWKGRKRSWAVRVVREPSRRATKNKMDFIVEELLG